MNNQQIKLIENKIQEINNLLTNWTNQIKNYTAPSLTLPKNYKKLRSK